MEKMTRNLNYNFIAVPTNLYFALDANLRNALTVLLQLSSFYCDKEGWFFRTNEDLQQDFRCGKTLTIACLESLFRYKILQVKSVGFTKKGKQRSVNFYRINFESFKDYEKFNIYTITKNPELQLDTVNYKAKDYKVTYTASTSTENEKLSPSDASNSDSGQLSMEKTENVTEGSKMPSNETVEPQAITDEQIQQLLNDNENECPLLESELKEAYGIYQQEDETVEPFYELDDILGNSNNIPTKKEEIVETASVVPTETNKIEVRNNNNSSTVDGETLKACYDLANRYCAMIIPSATKSVEMCNQACEYIRKMLEKGKILESDYKRLQSVIIAERFKKHPI